MTEKDQGGKKRNIGSIRDVDNVLVRQLRENRGWTLTYTAERAGICGSSMWKIENTTGRGIRRSTLEGLGRAFGIEPDSLRLGRGSDRIFERTQVVQKPRNIRSVSTEELEAILQRAQRIVNRVSGELEKRGIVGTD